MKYQISSVLLALALLFAACNPWDDHTALSDKNMAKNMVELIADQEDLSTFAAMLQQYGYDQTLADMSSCTVFAPVNAAWEGIDLNDSVLVKGILGSMITDLKIRSNDATYNGKILAINGKAVGFDADEKTFEGIAILTADLAAANGMLHKVEAVSKRKDNLWEALDKLTQYKQVRYLLSMNTQVIDLEKSVPSGLDENGKITYDPIVMKDYNAFLEKYPLNNEREVFSYFIVEDAAYDRMLSKYAPCFRMESKTGDAWAFDAALTDSIAAFNLCGDYVLPFLLEEDSLAKSQFTNFDGIKIPFSQANVQEVIDCSNGYIYILSDCNISLKSKIRPIRIEGENYNGCMNPFNLATRYKSWASGGYDVMLYGKSKFENFPTQQFTGTSSSATNLFNGTNYYIEYLAQVNSVDYAIYYVAHDDYEGHDGLALEQKLFISMPNRAKLNTKNATDSVANNYLGNARCFVGSSWAASPNPERVRLTQWDLDASAPTQYLIDKGEVKTPEAKVMTVPTMGEITMWLCNTTRYNNENAGFMFLDYIELVPIVND